jgi:uncharacterized protein (TIGR03086 family)
LKFTNRIREDLEMDTINLINQAAAVAGQVASGLSTDQRSNSTPCAEYEVHDLAAHMAGFYMGSAIAAAKGERPTGGDPSELLGTDPSGALVDLSSKMATAWSTPGALDGSTQFGPGEMPAEMAANITVLETLVHGWDLAKATGQEIVISDDLANASLATAQMICNDDSRAGGFFGPSVDAPAGSGAFDQALALTGRDPAWSA